MDISKGTDIIRSRYRYALAKVLKSEGFSDCEVKRICNLAKLGKFQKFEKAIRLEGTAP